MSVKMRKVLDYGTADQLVARVSFQWIDILDWFDLVDARRHGILEILTLKLQPKLLSCRTTIRGLKLLQFTNGIEEEPTGTALATLGKTQECVLQLQLARDDFCEVLGVILDFKVQQCTTAELLQWAQHTLGTHAPVTGYLAQLKSGWNQPLIAIQSLLCPRILIHTPDSPTPHSSIPHPPSIELVALAINELDTLTGGLVALIEAGMLAALTQVPLRAPVAFAEIPESERNPEAPVRFRAMVEESGGTPVAAGKFSQNGNLVPELQRVLQQGLGKPIIALKHMGQWFVASGSRLYHSPRWKNFHDFLGDYIKDVLGRVFKLS